MTENLVEKMLKSKKIFDGSIIKLFFDQVILPNNKKATREKVWHPGAVAVVPLTPENEIILIRQFRYPVNDVLIEIPAGKLDKDEPPLECAKRELEEEIGAFGGRFIHLTSFYTTPGFSNEFLHLYMAVEFESRQNHLDEDEFLQIIKISLKESIKWVSEGKIRDAKSIIGILMTERYLKNGILNNKFL